MHRLVNVWKIVNPIRILKILTVIKKERLKNNMRKYNNINK